MSGETDDERSDRDALEAPLRALEPELRSFAREHDMRLEREKEGPARRLEWASGGVSRAIEVALRDTDPPRWGLWTAAWTEEEDARRARSADLLETTSADELEERIPGLLENARRTAESWGREDLEPWADPGSETLSWRAVVFFWIPFLIVAAVVIQVVDWILESLL